MSLVTSVTFASRPDACDSRRNFTTAAFSRDSSTSYTRRFVWSTITATNCRCFFQRQLINADRRGGRGVALAFHPSVILPFQLLLRNAKELSCPPDIAMPNQFCRPRQKLLGDMRPFRQFGNRRRTPPTARRTPKLRDAHPQFDRAIRQRQVPHTVQVASLIHLVTDAATRTQRHIMFGTTVDRSVRSACSTVADTTSNPERLNAVVQACSLDILVSAKRDSETVRDNATHDTTTTTSCGHKDINKH